MSGLNSHFSSFQTDEVLKQFRNNAQTQTWQATDKPKNLPDPTGYLYPCFFVLSRGKFPLNRVGEELGV
jgi:hypothetical protein